MCTRSLWKGTKKAQFLHGRAGGQWSWVFARARSPQGPVRQRTSDRGLRTRGFLRITSTIVADGEHAQRRVPERRSARALLPALQNSRLHVAALGEPLGWFASSRPESELGTLRFLEGDVLDAVHDLGLKG